MAQPGPARQLKPRNLVTYLSLVAGWLSVPCALRGDVHAMAALWVVAVVADVFDGAFARLFGGDEEDARFGIELDSLVDAVSFGAFPVAGLYLAGGEAGGALFLAGAVCYLMAVVTRLGDFNLGALQGRSGFRGLPTTEAALVLATVLLLPGAMAWAWALLLAMAAAMLAPVALPRPGRIGKAIYLLWPAAVLLLHLWQRGGAMP